MLYRPEDFEPRIDEPWDEARIRAGVREIVADTDAALRERTGDERWLERARRFAVHALAQVRRQRSARGRGRYSLFTGDPGVALYLASCLDADAGFPVLDA